MTPPMLPRGNITVAARRGRRWTRLACLVLGHRWHDMEPRVRLKMEGCEWTVASVASTARACNRCGETTPIHLDLDPGAAMDSLWLIPRDPDAWGA